jgi:hypothetical protein
LDGNGKTCTASPGGIIIGADEKDKEANSSSDDGMSQGSVIAILILIVVFLVVVLIGVIVFRFGRKREVTLSGTPGANTINGKRGGDMAADVRIPRTHWSSQVVELILPLRVGALG